MFPPPPQYTATPESIAADAKKLVEHSRHLRDELVRNVTPSTAIFDNVMLPLAHMENDFSIKEGILGFYQDVSGDEQLRDASKKAATLFDDFQAESFMREDIFALINAVRKRDEHLDQESSLFLQRVYDYYIRAGAGIKDAAQKQRFRVIEERLSHLRLRFRQNQNVDKSSICFTSAELEGVPETYLSKLERTENEDDFRVVLSNSDHTEIISYAENPETRKRVCLARDNRCGENTALLKEAVILRHERANILGYPNHAAFQLNDKMAKTPETVNDFLADLKSRFAPSGLRAMDQLKRIKKTQLEIKGLHDQPDGQFFPWDYDFYNNISKKQQVTYDREMIREYFPLETTIVSMLEIVAHLFGIEFTELKGSNKPAEIVWHEDVQVFQVQDNRDRGGEFLGHLYLDLFRRPDKYAGAACFTINRVSKFHTS
jgi:metallopeptidase MepB